MIIQKITQQTNSTLIKNLKTDFEKYSANYVNIDNKITFDNNEYQLIQNGNYEIEDLYLTDDSTGLFDFENSKKIYTSFEFLSPTEANDERLWVALTHIYFHDYVVKRWMKPGVKMDVILDRFFYEGNSQVARSRNAISRLWWTAYLTINKTAENDNDKWRLTKAIFESQDLQVSLLERKLGLYENFRTAFLEYYIDNKSTFNSKKIQMIIREINNLGGVISLSVLEKDEIKKLLERYN